MKKDIVFLSQYFYPQFISSATLPYDVAKECAKSNLSVGALCGFPYEYVNDNPNIEMNDEVDGIQIQRINYIFLDKSKFFCRIISIFSLLLHYLRNLKVLGEYSTIIVYSDPPLMPIIACLAKKKYGCKIIFVAYDLYPEIAIKTGKCSQKGLISKVMNWINKRTYPKFDRIIALSTDMKSYIIKNRLVDEKKVCVIPNWYNDKGMIKRKEIPQTSMFFDIKDKFVISYFGNMGTAEDLLTITDSIELLRDNDNFFFLFAGHGNKMDKLKKWLFQNNIRNVRIHDYLHGDDFQNALAVSDCAIISLEKGLNGLCVPSKTYSYMMLGLPLLLILNDSDLLNDADMGAGYVIENGDANKLINCVKEMQANKFLHDQKSRICRQIYCKKYTTDICVKKYVDVIKELINEE